LKMPCNCFCSSIFMLAVFEVSATGLYYAVLYPGHIWLESHEPVAGGAFWRRRRRGRECPGHVGREEMILRVPGRQKSSGQNSRPLKCFGTTFSSCSSPTTLAGWTSAPGSLSSSAGALGAAHLAQFRVLLPGLGGTPSVNAFRLRWASVLRIEPYVAELHAQLANNRPQRRVSPMCATWLPMLQTIVDRLGADHEPCSNSVDHTRIWCCCGMPAGNRVATAAPEQQFPRDWPERSPRQLHDASRFNTSILTRTHVIFTALCR